MWATPQDCFVYKLTKHVYFHRHFSIFVTIINNDLLTQICISTYQNELFHIVQPIFTQNDIYYG